MRVVFLGTSAGMPTVERSLPSVAVTITSGRELLLFDCGEGTQVRFRQAHLKPGRLTRIFVSHLHADHVTGLLGLLLTLQMLGREEPLHLYGPPGLARFLQSSCELVQARWVYPTPVTEVREPGLVLDAGEFTVTCGLLEHRTPTLGYLLRERDRPGAMDVERAAALGLQPGPVLGQLQRGESVTTPDGRLVRPEEVMGLPKPGLRLAYCSDTRPCQAALDLARGADLLIHEGTFDAEMAEDARLKAHSTVVEAAEVARSAGARRLAITHVSPRYSDPELLLAQAVQVFADTLIASDLQEIAVPQPPVGR